MLSHRGSGILHVNEPNAMFKENRPWRSIESVEVGNERLDLRCKRGALV